MGEYVVDLKGLKELAQNLAKQLKGDEVIALIGDLGTGKTTFTKFLVEALKPEEGTVVRSPTFAVLNEYKTQKGTVYHADLYRVKSFDFTDYIGSGILIVEWADLDPSLDTDIVIHFQHEGDNLRRVKIERKKSVNH
ncbi:MAG: tRNA (adenosine(37)-N6)-threonylcarbamoyltransferase complex ATPase subunit type 1 TsaE [Aquificaceae bacterium]|nr:MAG: tRNA (adenosine(37)-N6)-threonylcarbamoyltransferase complex ATPase subunit type 1 TsaE [Aquificaceae bacterium]